MTQHLYILTGASRGMGAAMAAQLVKPGHTLLCISRKTDDELAAQAKAASVLIEQWSQDLAQGAQAADRLAKWLQAHGCDTVASATLINNAGVMPAVSPLSDADPPELAHALRVGLEAPMQLTAAFLHATCAWPVPRKVLNISSGLGRRAMASQTAYCAAKAGMDHFTRCLALEEALKANGACVCSLAPGVIDTDMQAQLRSADAASFPDRGNFQSLKDNGQPHLATYSGSKNIGLPGPRRFRQKSGRRCARINKHPSGFLYVELHVAILTRNRSLIDAILVAQPDCRNLVDAAGETALYLAVENGSVDIARQLVEAGADVDLRPAATTALIEAASHGNLAMVEVLLSRKAVDLKAQRADSGANALFLAAAHGRTSIVKQLLRHSTNAKAFAWSTDRWGATALSIAAENGKLDTVRELRLPMEPPQAQTPRTQSLLPTNRCCVLKGRNISRSPEWYELAAESGHRELELEVIGGKQGISWEALGGLLQQHPTAGSHWFINAHGLKRTHAIPRHCVELSEGDIVPTNEVVRVLARAGASHIQIWSCDISEAARHMAMRLEHDLSWPVGAGTLRITFHAQSEVASLGELNFDSLRDSLHDLASPGNASRADLTDIYGSTELLFNQTTRKVTIKVKEAVTLNEIERRLPELDDDGKRQLVGNYILECCSSGKQHELRAAFERFGEWADENYSPYGDPEVSPLKVALHFDNKDVLQLLLQRAEIDLSDPYLLLIAVKRATPAMISLMLTRHEIWPYRNSVLAIERALDVHQRAPTVNFNAVEQHLASNPPLSDVDERRARKDLMNKLHDHELRRILY